MPLPSHGRRKSSYSTEREEACVAVRADTPGRVLVRDTKDTGTSGSSSSTGPRLSAP